MSWDEVKRKIVETLANQTKLHGVLRREAQSSLKEQKQGVLGFTFHSRACFRAGAEYTGSM